jgi:hypothetical protein
MSTLRKEDFLSLFDYQEYAFDTTKEEVVRLGESLGIHVPRYMRKGEAIEYLYAEAERRGLIDKLLNILRERAEEWLKRYKEMGWGEGVQKINKLLERISPQAEASTLEVSLKDVVGEPINFRGFVYAPLNEAGVILLFSRVMDDLGIIYESSPPTFPDMVARRRTAKGYERVYIEFEFKSSNFIKHGHDPSKCDIIVCWEHDWRECPIEVIELKEIVRRLKA